MRFFQLLARPFVVFVERYYPDPFVFVVLLSALTFLLSLFLAEATPAVALSAWGDGLPSLVASAYAGFVIWHMGYSSSAGLFVATAGHSLEAEIGIIPITETVFTLHNGLRAAASGRCKARYS